MIDVDVKTKPDVDHAARLLGNLGRSLDNKRDPLEKSSEVISRSVAETIVTAGRGTWEPLDPGTIKNKARDGFPPDPLIRTGALLRAVRAKARWHITQSEADFGHLRAARYGYFHMTGTDRGMPARPWAVVYPDDERQIHEVFEDWVTAQIRLHLAGWR
jgi:phage gpG-like protein